MKMNKISVIVIVLVIVLGGMFLFAQQRGDTSINRNDNAQERTTNNLTPVTSFTHAHGIAVDIADPNNLYIATHHGLLVLKNDKDLYQIGAAKDDYMSFSPHPTDPKIFFSSGHPEIGGNIGFQKSMDGGLTWEKISDGINGPVDFHAMAVSSVNPDLVYGWYQGTVQRSVDGGKSWEIASTTTVPIVNLATDSNNESIVYAATPQGLMVSKDKGSKWTILLDGFVSAIAISPNDSQELISFSEKNGLAKSNDGGGTWNKSDENFNSETPLFISFNKQNPEIVYLLTEKNSIYKSSDGAISWTKIR